VTKDARFDRAWKTRI